MLEKLLRTGVAQVVMRVVVQLGRHLTMPRYRPAFRPRRHRCVYQGPNLAHSAIDHLVAEFQIERAR
jgi:hypothetical protein